MTWRSRFACLRASKSGRSRASALVDCRNATATVRDAISDGDCVCACSRTGGGRAEKLRTTVTVRPPFGGRIACACGHPRQATGFAVGSFRVFIFFFSLLFTVSTSPACNSAGTFARSAKRVHGRWTIVRAIFSLGRTYTRVGTAGGRDRSVQ